ncbi:MAG: DUF1801 domain-containing protein [Blastocatellia bacterium]
MAELKTRETDASVDAYLDAIENEQRRTDCRAICDLMRRVTKYEARMWGPSIVGFGSDHYKYDSGHEGDACLAGFSSRRNDITFYIVSGFEGYDALLARLGKHKTGKVCLYIKRLADIDTGVLEKIIKGSVAEMKRRYPK